MRDGAVAGHVEIWNLMLLPENLVGPGMATTSDVRQQYHLGTRMGAGISVERRGRHLKRAEDAHEGEIYEITVALASDLRPSTGYGLGQLVLK